MVLALLVYQNPNLLLLDEPTNHLDLATREALSMALNEFEGTVMLVSHDRALLRAVCDEFWMVGRGKVEPFDGDLDDYQRYLLEESKRLREEAKGASSAAPMQPQPEKESPAIKASELETTPTLSAAEQRKLEAQRRQQLATQLRPFKKELEQNEQRMAVIEQEKSDLEMQLSGPLPSTEIAEAGRRQALDLGPGRQHALLARFHAFAAGFGQGVGHLPAADLGQSACLSGYGGAAGVVERALCAAWGVFWSGRGGGVVGVLFGAGLWGAAAGACLCAAPGVGGAGGGGGLHDVGHRGEAGADVTGPCRFRDGGSRRDRLWSGDGGAG